VRTKENSRSLRFGRDDKGWGGTSIERLVSGLRELRFIIRSIRSAWKRHPPFVIPYQELCLRGQPHAGGYGLGLGPFEPAAQAAGELSYQL
jgi:hypothetical protein